MRNLAVTIAVSLLLVGCGGDNDNGADSVDFSNWVRASLVAAYPRNGQTEVPVTAPVALRFSHPLTTAEPTAALSLETAGGQAVAFSAETFDNSQGILITPDEPLAPNTTYVADSGAQTTEYGAVQMPDGGLTFTTRAKQAGTTQAIASDPEAFTVSRLIPGGQALPIMDFSALRVQLTQPLDTASLSYASDGSIALLDAGDNLVEAHVLAKGRYLTIDPVEPMTAGDEYTLVLGEGLRSTLGQSLQPGDYGAFSFTPRDSRPREVLVQQAAASNPEPAQRCGPDTPGDTLSPLTGSPINCVPLQSMLLGNTTRVQQQGVLTAELAFPPHYPDVTPFRVPRGTLLKAAAVEVLIAGVAPTGYDSGKLSVTFLSDAVGYLMPNPYSNAVSAPKQVQLFMDIALTTDNAKPNGALSQNLMHVELVGSGLVKDGRLVIDAVGVVEPNILGQEYGQALISFQLASFRDQETASPPAADSTGPTLQSWLPGEDAAGDSRAGEMRPGDPLIVNLSEPVDPATVVANQSVTLSGPAGTQVGRVRVDGATLVIEPEPALEYGGDYTIALTAGITDLAGNALMQTHSLEFTMPHFVDGPDRAPVVISSYPGYPCVTTGRDIANVDHGRCAGGRGDDDHLPVTTLPANQPIEVQFSREMDPASIALDGSFTVEVNSDSDGNGTWSAVPGRLELGARVVRFHPDTPWDDGALYRYTLGSNGDETSASAVCDGSDALCSEAGYPLQTQMLDPTRANAPAPTGGGPDMAIYFRGAPATDSVLLTFRNLPTVDVNANFVYDGRGPDDDDSDCTPQTCEALPAVQDGEPVVEENSSRIIVADTGNLAQAANVGCEVSDDCPAKQFAWLTAGLNVEVAGTGTFPDTQPGHPAAGRPAVKVPVHPTIFYTSNLDVYAQLGLGLIGGGIINVPVQIPSGPLIMRLRYEADDSGERRRPISGWIYEVQPGDQFSDGENYEVGQPVFEVQADVYLDAPYLELPLVNVPLLGGLVEALLGHNLYSNDDLHMTLRGPVTFTRDGRLQVRLRNVESETINVQVDVGGGNLLDGVAEIDLQMPAAGTSLVFTQPAIKE